MEENSVCSTSLEDEGGSSVHFKHRRRKRVKRACDQCRLQKARCDGTKSCETCNRYNRICIYKLTSNEFQDPASRINILEQPLSKANDRFAELQQHNAVVDQKQNVALLHGPEIALESNSSSKVDVSVATTSMIDIPLIQSLLGSLLHGEDIDALVTTHSTNLLFDNTCIGKSILSKKLCQLPTYETALEAIYSAFTGVFGLGNIVEEQPFRIATQRLYDMDSFLYMQEDIDFIPLFYIIAALGVVKCPQMKQKLGHEKAYQGSLLYFEAANSAIATDRESSLVLKIQLRLCLVLYHLETSGLRLARIILQQLCDSSLYHDFLRRISAQSFSMPDSFRKGASGMIWTISYVDMQISSLTNLPLALLPTGSEIIPSTVNTINIAASNVANLKHSSPDFLLSVSLAMAIELRKMTHQVDKIATGARPGPTFLPTELTGSANLKEWDDLETGLHDWGCKFRTIFPEDECNPQLSLARNVLQLHLYMAQIDLYNSFLFCYSESVPMYDDEKFEEINRGRACVAAATNAILHTSTHLAQVRATNLTWTSAYTVLVSAIVLLVAITHTNTHVMRCEMYGTLSVANQILRCTTYGNSHTKKMYLDLLQNLSAKVMMPSDSISIYHSQSRDYASLISGNSYTTMVMSPCSDTGKGADGEWGFDPGDGE